MKVRLGFVSNSSSSSFTCDVCGETESGWDMCLSDAEMYECENGHTVHEDCGVNVDIETRKQFLVKKFTKYANSDYSDSREYREKLERIADMDDDEIYEMSDEYEFRYYIPEESCPLCRMEVVSSNTVKRYLYKKHGISHDEVVKEIKEQFNSYADLLKFIR